VQGDQAAFLARRNPQRVSAFIWGRQGWKNLEREVIDCNSRTRGFSRIYLKTLKSDEAIVGLCIQMTTFGNQQTTTERICIYATDTTERLPRRLTMAIVHVVKNIKPAPTR
jgi:hypothetical protein